MIGLRIGKVRWCVDGTEREVASEGADKMRSAAETIPRLASGRERIAGGTLTGKKERRQVRSPTLVGCQLQGRTNFEPSQWSGFPQARALALSSTGSESSKAEARQEHWTPGLADGQGAAPFKQERSASPAVELSINPSWHPPLTINSHNPPPSFTLTPMHPHFFDAQAKHNPFITRATDEDDAKRDTSLRSIIIISFTFHATLSRPQY